MSKPHFFKAHSRIGLLHKPLNQAEDNSGVEDGPDNILNNTFLDTIGDYSLTSFSFPLPETIEKDMFAKVLAKSLNDFRDVIVQNMKDNERQLVVGGDHSVTLSSVLAVLQRIQNAQQLGYIHFDSHGDINQYADSPSKNFHGMYLRPLFDTFDIPEIDKLVPHKIPSRNALFVGNLDLDKGEKDFFNRMHIRTLSKEDFLSQKEKALQEFSSFINQFEYLHVSFDVDVLDKSVFPATGIPAEHGFLLEDLMPFLQTASKHRRVSFDLTEFNPHKNGATKSQQVAQNIIEIFCR